MCTKAARVPWPAVRNEILSEASELTCAIDEVMDELPDACLHLAEYPYGDLIVNDGCFIPPCGPQPCAECRELERSFDGALPLALLLDNCVEVFVPGKWDARNPRHAPLRIISKGEIFGVFETLDGILGNACERPPWGVSAGARSVWVIAPLGNVDMIKRFFVSLGYGRAAWKDGEPAWQLIRAWSAKRTEWRARIAIFPKAVVDHVRQRRSGRLFQLLLETGWTQSSALRHAAIHDARLHEHIRGALDSFGAEHYHFATIRHWLNIVNGSAPAFVPYWMCSNAGGPFLEFEADLASLLAGSQSAYHPVILQPAMLDSVVPSGYYSVRCPSVPGPAISERAYAGMIDRFEDVLRASELFPDGTVRCFAKQPRAAGSNGSFSPLRGFDSAPEADFLQQPGTRQVFWGSPFFVAGAKLSKTGEPVGMARSSSTKC